ncbi:hypothetical protein [Rhizobium phage RHph_X2_28B]|uniref:hypothetical protein n=1 Tax=Rhizobium phage RHph_X2_28B TaxID=2836086 RepID=UPI0023293A6A|nr:hypothetical protein PP751_gp073 [Rhizobium phage RHph_X2_28B]QWY83525.1 hypothetical protein [Rhizobium phage RHph_X2_28B]
MSDLTNQNENPDNDLQMPSELDMLKSRARVMGIPFSNNIGVEALKERIQAKLDGEANTTSKEEGENEATDPSLLGSSLEGTAPEKPETPAQMRARIRAENLKLVRLRITNLDPKKKDLPGEIFTVANELLGTIRKFVPFGEATDNGYHVPNVIYKMMKRRKFLQIKVKKVQGKEVIETQWVREFALEELPQLTRPEIDKLAAAQAAAGGVE